MTEKNRETSEINFNNIRRRGLKQARKGCLIRVGFSVDWCPQLMVFMGHNRGTDTYLEFKFANPTITGFIDEYKSKRDEVISGQDVGPVIYGRFTEHQYYTPQTPGWKSRAKRLDEANMEIRGEKDTS